MKFITLSHALTLAAAGLVSTSMGLDADPAKMKQSASFKITDVVVNENVEAFTATIGSFGNALHTASFEPAHFRTRFFALADAPDRVVLDKTNMTSWDSLRDGFFEDADVLVYRIMDGKMRIVRKDTVAKGGSRMASSKNTSSTASRPARIGSRLDSMKKFALSSEDGECKITGSKPPPRRRARIS